MNRLRRALAGTAAGAVAASGLSVLGVIAAPTASAETITIDDATFTWGVSGYAQKGIFGPWTFKDLTGDATYLEGSTTNGAADPQDEYVVAPVPATSMPASTPQKTPNAVKFTDGTGTQDSETGAVEVSWTGSYTVNAYPVIYGAPNEIYADPQLSLDEDGSGELTMEFTIGAGQDMSGNPTEPIELGRVPVMTYSAGAAEPTSLDSFRLTPDYQGVEVSPEALEDASSEQNRTCTAEGGATGWWGSWPEALVDVIPSFVRPHFYSTGCGGMQDNKPALPADVDLGLAYTGEVEVSDTTLLPSGDQEITVTGTGFDPAAATGSRPPLAGKPSGVYVAVGRYADTWKPSAGAPSSARVNGAVKWAVLAEDMGAIGGADRGAIELTPEGTFETTLTVSKETIDDAVDDAVAEAGSLDELADYGVVTYPGGGATAASYETFTPIAFAKKKARTIAKVAKRPTTKRPGRLTVRVTDGATGAAAVVVKKGKRTVLKRNRPLNRNSAFAVTLPKRRAGKYRVVVVYQGDANHTRARDTARYRIAKPKRR